jgi:molecular chaperone GrpE
LAKKKKKQVTPEPEVVETTTDETTEEETEAVVEESEELSPEEQLQQELETAREETQKNWDLYLRERAEMDNLRKRHQRDKEDAIRFANDRLLKEMIPVLDNLERAVEHAEQGEDDDSKGLLEGVNMTITQFRKALEDFGIKPITAIGEDFDPNLHQAMGQIESAEQPPNTVVNEFQKGYLLHDRLLRPSLVIVAKAPSEEADDQGDEQESTEE